jgi:hypothetical protein
LRSLLRSCFGGQALTLTPSRLFLRFCLTLPLGIFKLPLKLCRLLRHQLVVPSLFGIIPDTDRWCH